MTKTKKILIIRFSSLGDIILTEPIIRQLRISYPGCTVDYLTKKAFEPIITTFFGVDSVFTDYESLVGLIKLRRRKYDLVIDLQKKFNSWWAKGVIAGKKNVSYDKKRRLRKRIVARKTSLTINSTVDLYNTVFDKLELPYSFQQPRIKTSQSDNLLPSANPKDNLKLVIFPGATHNTKRIPPDKIISFINDYPHKDTDFYLLGSVQEGAITAKIKKETNKLCYDLAGNFNLVELINAIDLAHIVITNDSGPMHIAAALEKPQLAFFGSTHISLGFRPLNNKAIVLSRDLECSPCTLHGEKACPLKHFNCLNQITVESIFEAYQNLLTLI